MIVVFSVIIFFIYMHLWLYKIVWLLCVFDRNVDVQNQLHSMETKEVNIE